MHACTFHDGKTPLILLSYEKEKHDLPSISLSSSTLITLFHTVSIAAQAPTVARSLFSDAVTHSPSAPATPVAVAVPTAPVTVTEPEPTPQLSQESSRESQPAETTTEAAGSEEDPLVLAPEPQEESPAPALAPAPAPVVVPPAKSSRQYGGQVPLPLAVASGMLVGALMYIFKRQPSPLEVS